MLLSKLSYSQTYTAKISGSIVGNFEEVIPDVTVSLYKGSDSITSVKSNLEGLFLMEAELLDQSEYRLKLQNETGIRIDDELTFQTEMYRTDFVFDLAYPYVKNCHLNGHHIAYYLANETKKIDDFDVEWLLDFQTDRPEICIEFAQVIVHSESEKIAKKRMSNFKKYLEECGVDMSRVLFDETIHYLTAFHDDQRSRIEGVIHSFDSPCH